MPAPTFIEILESRASLHPHRIACRFLIDGEVGGAVEEWTYADLFHRSSAIAAHLSQLKLRGERALMLYPPGLEFVSAFFGCLMSKVIAVPTFPPNLGRLHRTLPRLLSVAGDCQPAAVLTTASSMPMKQKLQTDARSLAEVRWIATDLVPPTDPPRATIAPEDLSYLQYTSGSTSSPKGVMLTHDNIIATLEDNNVGAHHTERARWVSWVPNFHDLGLVYGVLQPLYVGAEVTFLSPGAFLEKPLRWLSAIHHFRGTHSSGPNFAYELCVRRISEAMKVGLDLSSLRLTVISAEPIRPSTLRRFTEAFARCGFRNETFAPCFGMAEATLKITSATGRVPRVHAVDARAIEHNRVEPARDPASTMLLVGCGSPGPRTELAIVDPLSLERVPPGDVGEIWVRSPNVARGYWNRPTETKEVFGATIAGEGGGPYLRTGDLGFMRDGELVVSGRLKDLIIVRGRNHYPQDIERVVEEADPSMRPGSSAAFAVDVENEERVVVIAEFDPLRGGGRDPRVVLRRVRDAVAAQLSLPFHRIILLEAGTIPKTPSGKAQRHACKRAFERGELCALASWSAPNLDALDRETVITYLTEFAADALRREDVTTAEPLIQLGLDSLMALEIRDKLRHTLGVALPMVAFQANPTILTLADRIVADQREGSAAEAVQRLDDAAVDALLREILVGE
jgi:acyl-CoA synthetase (AMP-forming)/AMP-acid ligase II/acyl carrier protein